MKSCPTARTELDTAVDISLSPQDELLHLPHLTETESEVLKGMFLLQSEQKEFSLL